MLLVEYCRRNETDLDAVAGYNRGRKGRGRDGKGGEGRVATITLPFMLWFVQPTVIMNTLLAWYLLNFVCLRVKDELVKLRCVLLVEWFSIVLSRWWALRTGVQSVGDTADHPVVHA